MDTEIRLAAAESLNPKYDAACKMLFQNREIIAPVLKAVVPEYRNCTMEEVIACIDASSIRDDAVDDISIVVNQLPTEQESVSEKLIRYDTHFRALNPLLSTKDIRFFLHIDLEVQNDYNPGNPSYPIVRRGIYYAAREISSQLGILTETTNYGDLEKVYSIWICNDGIPLELQNTVTAYRFSKQDEIGCTDEPDSDYDLMSVILIRRGNDNGTAEIFDYLTGIFTSNIDRLNKYVDLKANDALMEGVTSMCGLGESIATKNYTKGMQQGMQQGVQQGMLSSIRNLIANLHMAPQEAMNALGIPAAEQPEYISLLNMQP